CVRFNVFHALLPSNGKKVGVRSGVAQMNISPAVVVRHVESSPTVEDIGPPPAEDDEGSHVLSPPFSPPPPSTGSFSGSIRTTPVVEVPRSFESFVRKPVRRPGTTNNLLMAEMQVNTGVLQSATTSAMSTGRVENIIAPGCKKTPRMSPFSSGSDVENSCTSVSLSRCQYSTSIIPVALTAGASPRNLIRRHQITRDSWSPIIPQAAADGSRDAPFPPLTLVDMNQAIQRSIQEYQRAMSLLNHSMPFTRVQKAEHPEEMDTTTPSTHPKVCLGEFQTRCDAHSFVASFLSAHGYKEALRSFEMHLPLAEKQLQSCLYHHQKQKRVQSQHLDTASLVRQGRQDTSSSPTYALTSDDLLLFVMESVRRRQLLNDSLPWREINCQRKDYRLEPLEQCHSPQDQNPVSGDGDSAIFYNSAVGGSLELLIEVLIFVETDVPFTTGMPITNYTNTFILLSSLFVMPEALIVRLIRLFRHVQKQPRVLLDDSRRVFLLRRIVHFMTAYCKYHEADVTYALLDRLRQFLQSLNATTSVGHSLHDVQSANFGGKGTSTTATQQIGGDFSLVSAEVTPRLDELRIFVERALEKTYTLFPERDGRGVCWQRKLTASVRPLGTILKKELKQQDGAVQAERVGSSLQGVCLKMEAYYTEVAFTAVAAKTLAIQLCLLSFKLFADIRLRELLNNAWCDSTMRMSVPFYLSRFVDYSSHVQRWMTALIVSPTRWSECQKVMIHGIRVCRFLYEEQNYEMASAMLQGLQHPAVVTLEELYKKHFQCRSILSDAEEREFTALQKIMDPFASHESPSSYSFVSNQALEETRVPMIPLLAPLLGVLFRTEESKGRTVELSPTTGVPIVNWSKIMAIGRTSFFVAPLPKHAVRVYAGCQAAALLVATARPSFFRLHLDEACKAEANAIEEDPNCLHNKNQRTKRRRAKMQTAIFFFVFLGWAHAT
ncbi:hypothetical protein TcCL_ESM00495, partial [Trypanosoma cruzi]